MQDTVLINLTKSSFKMSPLKAKIDVCCGLVSINGKIVHKITNVSNFLLIVFESVIADHKLVTQKF